MSCRELIQLFCHALLSSVLLSPLLQEVDNAEKDIVETLGSETFAFARECACSLYNCCDIRKSDRKYNAVRDSHMAEKVQWFIEHGDGSVISSMDISEKSILQIKIVSASC